MSKLVGEAVEMRNQLQGSNWKIGELMRLYIATPVSDYFVYPRDLYVSTKLKNKKRKRKFF